MKNDGGTEKAQEVLGSGASPGRDQITDRGGAPGATAWFERRLLRSPTYVGEEGIVEVVLCIDDSLEAMTPKGYVPLTIRNAESLPYPEPKETLLGTETIGGRTVRVYRIERRAFYGTAKGALDFEGPSASDLGGAAGSAPKKRSIVVIDAPTAGRSADFHEGDVGLFTLAAEVRPRQIHPGGVTRLTVTLEGFGHLPTAITLPTRAGVSFGSPLVREALDVRADHLHRTRTFVWDLTVTSPPGSTDLGAVTLPFFDPTLARFQQASATLGAVATADGPAEIQTLEHDETDAGTTTKGPSEIVVSSKEDAPFLNPDSPLTTGLGIGLLVGGAAAIVLGLRRRKPEGP